MSSPKPVNADAPDSDTPSAGAAFDPETILASNRDVAKPFWVEKTKREAGKAWNLFYKQSLSPSAGLTVGFSRD